MSYDAHLELLKLERRFNPNHGKGGKFSSGGSGGAGSGGGLKPLDGSGGGGGGGGASAELMHNDEKTIKSVMGYHDKQTGLTAEVKSITNRNGRNGDTKVAITVRDRDGHVMGSTQRIIHPAEQGRVHISEDMHLGKDFQGQGFTARYEQHTEAGYKAHGYTKVTAQSNMRDVSGYSNARKGFNFADAASRAKVAKTFNGVKLSPGSKIQGYIDRLVANPNTTPIEFAMVGHTAGATSWHGKGLMTGSVWTGEKNL